MRKRWIVIACDAAAVFAAFFLAYLFRFFSGLFPERGIPPLLPYLKIDLLTVCVWMILCHTSGLYRDRLFFNRCAELALLIQSSFWAMVFLMAATFLSRGFLYSRLVIGFGGLFAFLFLWGIHWTAVAVERRRVRTVLLLGDERSRRVLISRLGRQAALCAIESRSPLSDAARIRQEVSERRPDYLLVAGAIAGNESLGLRQIAQEFELPCYVMPDVSPFVFAGRIEDVDGLPLLLAGQLPMERFPAPLVKRTMDIAGASALFALCLPLLLLIAAAIAAESGRPVIFRQERIGKGGRKFWILKFRTMRAAGSGHLPFTAPDDPRCTRVGRFLRRFNLDELPQMLNVLRGEMSLVGPRPISVEDSGFFSVPGFDLRLRAIPGITGWAQVHGLRGGRGEMEERIQYDLYYIENWSLSLDLAILLCSPFAFRNAF